MGTTYNYMYINFVRNKIAFPERYTYLEDPSVENVDIFTKGTATVAANLRENLNMSCNIVQVDNYGWNINGTFNGAMGLFQQKRIQILSHATIMREDRLKYVEFTAELFVVEYGNLTGPYFALVISDSIRTELRLFFVSHHYLLYRIYSYCR